LHPDAGEEKAVAGQTGNPGDSCSGGAHGLHYSLMGKTPEVGSGLHYIYEM
jgi:hypothetical protein